MCSDDTDSLSASGYENSDDSDDCDPPITPAKYFQSFFPTLYRYRRQAVPPTDQRLSNYTMDVVTAIRTSNIEQLRAMIQRGRSLDACNSNGETLLHLACRRATLETVEFLLDEGKVPWALADCMGRTALFDACWRPRPDVEILDALMRKVSVVLLFGEDTWGHCCFDYVQRNDYGVWIDFLDSRREMLVQRTDTFVRCNNISTAMGTIG